MSVDTASQGIEVNKQVVTDLMEAFSAGDAERLLGMLDDSATWTVMGDFPLAGTYDKQAFAELLAGIGPEFEGPIRLTPTQMTAEEDRVAVEAESYGERKDGRVYQNRYHFLFTVRDGKVHSVNEHNDTMHANQVLCEPA